MAASMKFCLFVNRLGSATARCCRINGSLALQNIRQYTIEPPAWMGGKFRIELPDKYEFPTRTKTFDERMRELSESEREDKAPQVDIGAEYSPPARDRNALLSVSLANKKNKSLEQAARLDKLVVPLREIRSEQMMRYGPAMIRRIAEHYGIFNDLFGNAFFYPVVPLNIAYEYDADTITPVYFGNRILASECKEAPKVIYEVKEEGSSKLWTLLMTSPDSHLSDSSAEYVHWLVGNIPGKALDLGETLVDYLQPIPANGTGYHRLVFVLFEQNNHIDYSAAKLSQPYHDLKQRTFRTQEFFKKHSGQLVPKGLAFFQCEWDESVRRVFHKTLDMEEPTFEYMFPPAYHPPPKKYPHKEPFDRYFDRYRDRKDLAEEVLRKKLCDASPFQKRPEPEKYPLIHKPKSYKPTWLQRKEELMHRRLEQFRDLN